MHKTLPLPFLLALLLACGDDADTPDDGDASTRTDAGETPTDDAGGSGGSGGGGADGDAGTDAGADAATDAGPDASSPDEDAGVDAGPEAPHAIGVRHVDGQTLAIDFDGPIDPAQVEVEITPVNPTALAQVALVAGDTDTLELSLNRHPLPIDYAIKVTVMFDGATHSDDLTLDARDVRSRVIFVSKLFSNGDLKDHPSKPTGSVATTGLGVADEFCQAEAEDAGLAGTYRAMLGDATDHGYCRIYGVGGTRSGSQCNGADLPAEAPGPWIDPVGMPVLASVDGLLDVDGWINTVQLHADATVPSHNGNAWVGHLGGGAPANCGGWDDGTVGNNGFGYVSVTNVVPGTLTNPAHTCDLEKAVVCMQIDAGGVDFEDNHRVDGLVAFVSDATDTGIVDDGAGATGAEGADALCQAQAVTLGLDDSGTRTFVAWLSDSSRDAYCHAAGFTGTRGADCGEGALPNPTGPYVRPDGRVLAADLLDFSGGMALGVPLMRAGSATSIASNTVNSVWTGSVNGGIASADNCSNWASEGTNGARGLIPYRTFQWGGTGALPCTNELGFVCVEQP